MKRLSNFVSTHRERFSTESSNVFAFSFGKVSRHWGFLEIIHQRYVDESKALVDNSKAIQALVKPGMPPVTGELAALLADGQGLSAAVHLEIESFYLFAKILLDEIAHAIEHYFGPARGAPLSSHDDLCKNLSKYAAARKLKVPEGFQATIKDLQKRISDFRDKQISHEKSPRTMKGTMWDMDGNVRIAATRLYPRATDTPQQVESESLDRLKTALETYAEEVIKFIEVNKASTRLELALK